MVNHNLKGILYPKTMFGRKTRSFYIVVGGGTLLCLTSSIEEKMQLNPLVDDVVGTMVPDPWSQLHHQLGGSAAFFS